MSMTFLMGNSLRLFYSIGAAQVNDEAAGYTDFFNNFLGQLRPVA